MDLSFRRGDIVWFNDDPPHANTHVQHGRRPAIVVSANDFNRRSATVVIAVTTGNLQKCLYQGQFFIRNNGEISRVCCDQIRVVDKHRLEAPHGHLGSDAVKQLNEALKYVIGLQDDATETELVNPNDVYTQTLPAKNS